MCQALGQALPLRKRAAGPRGRHRSRDELGDVGPGETAVWHVSQSPGLLLCMSVGH